MRALAAAVAVAMVALAASARADEPFVGDAEGSRVSLETIWLPGGISQVGAFDAQGQLQLTPRLALDLEVPWAVGQISGETSANAGLGNITPGLHGIWHPKDGLVLSFGATISIPTTYRIGATNEALGAASALYEAASARAGYDEYRYLPEFFSVRVPFTLEVRMPYHWRYRLEVLAGLTFPGGTDVYWVGSPTFYEGTISYGVWVESSSTFVLRLPNAFLLGLRTQFLALEPLAFASFVEELTLGYEPPAGFFARLRGLLGVTYSREIMAAEIGGTLGYRF